MSEQLVLALLLVLISALFHIVPGITRPDLFFAVTVDPQFRRMPEGQGILRRYRAIVWTATLVALALEFATHLIVAAILLQAAGYLWALIAARHRTLAHAAPPSTIVEVNLTAPPEGLPGGTLAAILPFLLLAALGLWTALHFDRLPARFPAHWGIYGPDRWLATTPASIFGLFAVNACLCLLLAGLAWGMLHWSRHIAVAGPAATGERQFRRRVARLILVTAYFLICPAWFALYYPSTAAMNIWGLAFIAAILVLTVDLLRRGQGGTRTAATSGVAPAGDRTPDACWKWGLVYINPADPSLLVEKRFGIGYTLNFGHRKVWAVLGLVLVPAAVAVIFLR